MKQIWILTLFVIASFTSYAQRYGNHDAMNLRPVTESDAGQIMNGKIYYDINCSCFKFRENNAWTMLGGSATVTDGDKGDIMVSSGFWNVDNSAITFSKFQNISTSTILGRVAAGTGVASALTGTQVNTMLPVFTSTLKGLVPAPSSTPDGTKWLSDLGTFTTPPGSGSGTTETASNFLTKIGDNIEMGGTSIKNTTLTSAHNFKIVKGSYTFGIGTPDFFYDGFSMGWGDQAARSGQYSNIRVAPEGVYIQAKAATGGDVMLSIRNDGLTLTDNRTVKTGLMTGGTGYVTNARSYADKAYVDAAVAGGGGGGITNTAAPNELMKSDGTNAIPSGLYSTIAGNIFAGATTTSGSSRLFEARGSATNVSFAYHTKGTGSAHNFWVGGTERFRVNANGAYFPTLPANDDALTQVLVRDGASGQVKYRNASSLAGGDIPTPIATIEWTPTLSGATTNIDVVTIPSPWRAVRIGNMIILGGSIQIDATAIGMSQVDIEPASAPNWALVGQASGTAVNNLDATSQGALFADPTTDLLRLRVNSTSTSARTFSCHAIYVIP